MSSKAASWKRLSLSTVQGQELTRAVTPHRKQGHRVQGLQPGRSVRCHHHSMTDCPCVLMRFWAAKPERMNTVKGEVSLKPAYDVVARACAASINFCGRQTGLQTFGNVVLTFPLGFSVEAKQVSTCVPYK